MIEQFEYDEDGNRARIAALRARGVRIWSAERVFVASDVPPDAIEPGVTLMNAVISGPETLIRAGSCVGTSGIATLSNVKVGRSVELGAGSYAESVFFDRVKVRGFAEIRKGTVLEEQAEAAHNVGLKNTFFGPGVVAGSCINFCDAVVTGGTSRLDHTEIGSGAVHFNFAPNRDKFGSLLGGVTGLLLRSDRIFVGGNSGIVAPAVLDFGTVVPAGTTLRASAASEDTPLLDRLSDKERRAVRKLLSGARMLANLAVLIEWYRQVRLIVDDSGEQALVRGALRQIADHLAFRRTELGLYLSRVSPPSKRFSTMAERLLPWLEPSAPFVESMPAPEPFLTDYQSHKTGKTHIEALHQLAPAAVDAAANWLARTLSDGMTPVRSAVAAAYAQS